MATLSLKQSVSFKSSADNSFGDVTQNAVASSLLASSQPHAPAALPIIFSEEVLQSAAFLCSSVLTFLFLSPCFWLYFNFLF